MSEAPPPDERVRGEAYRVNDRARAPGVYVFGSEWGPDERRRPGLPWIGIFLVVFGGLLLLERVFPQFRLAGSAFLLAVGLVFLIRWAVERGTAALYAGAIITGLALPGVLESSGILSGGGLGTLCLGLSFLFIALVRSVTGGGIGWQALFGAILFGIGAARVALPGIGDLIVPTILVGLGLLLVLGGLGPGRRWR